MAQPRLLGPKGHQVQGQKYLLDIGASLRLSPPGISREDLLRALDNIPDKKDTRIIVNWTRVGDRLIYTEGWSDGCIAGWGYPERNEEGAYEEFFDVAEGLTLETIRRKATDNPMKEKLELLEGGWVGTPRAKKLYGITYAIYRKAAGLATPLVQTGYRCGGIGDFTGGEPEEAVIAWKSLNYEYYDLDNQHNLENVAQFLGIPPTTWEEVIGEFRRRYGDARGIWLTRTKKEAQCYYHEYGEPEPVSYQERDIIVDLGPEGIYVLDRSGQSPRPEGSKQIGGMNIMATDTLVEQTVQVAIQSGLMKVGKVRCVCPEMKADGVVTSKGGDTVSTWQYREKDRKAGKDVPIGGCICKIEGGPELSIWLDDLVVSRES